MNYMILRQLLLWWKQMILVQILEMCWFETKEKGVEMVTVKVRHQSIKTLVTCSCRYFKQTQICQTKLCAASSQGIMNSDHY